MSLKAKIANGLVALGLDHIVIIYWRLRGHPVEHLRAGTLRERFQSIYDSGVWVGNLPIESLSGKGSSVEGTLNVREALPNLLSDLKCASLLDVGCGDFNWMKHVPLGLRYTGIDVAPSVIEKNIALYSSEHVRFFNIDATSEPVPQCDAALCREVIFHLSFKHGLDLIKNLKKCGIKYLICTSDPDHLINVDIISGAWRELNLEAEPFRLGPPIARIEDAQADNPRRQLCVWRLDQIAVAS